MKLDSSRGVSQYLEVFILIGVVTAGTEVVYYWASRDVQSAPGAALTLSDASINQGTMSAYEKLVVYNNGQLAIGSLVLTTSGVSPSASYCYTVVNARTGSTTVTSCPTLAPNPSSVPISVSLNPGASVIVELTIIGNAFTIGLSYPVTINGQGGVASTLRVDALPG